MIDNIPRGISSQPSHSFHLVRCHPLGIVKLNFDGSLSNSSAIGGFILCDWTGKVLRLGAAFYGTTSILVAEARALREGVAATCQVGFHHLIIEGNNKIVIHALDGAIQIPWSIQYIIKDIFA